ncbi:hypothetical protein AGMMS49546_16310 [Spirochaetia bacterium]|nr:hypothetical protein AGMMS49546_16310 [Spirochaetia bacterium]
MAFQYLVIDTAYSPKAYFIFIMTMLYCISSMGTDFNEDTRVKIPAILTLTRLGYGYLSLKDAPIASGESAL